MNLTEIEALERSIKNKVIERVKVGDKGLTLIFGDNNYMDIVLKRDSNLNVYIELTVSKVVVDKYSINY